MRNKILSLPMHQFVRDLLKLEVPHRQCVDDSQFKVCQLLTYPSIGFSAT